LGKVDVRLIGGGSFQSGAFLDPVPMAKIIELKPFLSVGT
jgi:hypothetical protein